ncbi:hypothetical protein [Kitasatospora herbaricolor]|uniref:Uncharacterized protein n=1 Tax=Kitasatospora herbaricolor TaxID=68217 RepID=A0ABZ1WGK3_9ACTN|nr:hypothetical protein [Kitasatospora herbaricolor]
MLPLDARPPDGPTVPARPVGGAGTGRAGFGRAGFGPMAGRSPLPGAEDTVHLNSAQDTLQVIANADRWAQLTNALDEALVPLAVGDVDALRHLAKLEQPVLDALTRWIGTANRGRGGPPSRPAGRLAG